MAEGALFSLATNLLSTAHVATGDIEKLRKSIEAIRDVLLDAEKQQEDSAAVKSWIKRVGNLLYDADDLLDGMLTNVKLKQQRKESKIPNQVRDFFSLSNPLNYAYEDNTRAKALSKSLDLVFKDSKVFCFEKRQHEEQMSVVAGACSEVWSSVDSKGFIGRKAEKKDILEFLLEKSSNEEKNVPVIAIVGIGGMGKTTLAQLVYNDELEKNFEKKWWASVSDKHGDTEILREIYEAITNKNTHHELDQNQLEDCIRESVRTGKYLLVIDGVQDHDHTKWSGRIKLLHNGHEGSRIIVTTRSPLVARAVEATKTQKLSGLSRDESWELFKTIAFTPGKAEDPRWTSLGEVIVNNCSGVPLAIKIIAGHLHGRNMEEWQYVMHKGLSGIELSANPVMSALKLSYDRLPSILKLCFAYCALFPKYHVISKRKLLYLWIAQGYVTPETEEEGDAYFKQLLSTSFFREVGVDDEVGEIEHCKMHDLVHDLARIVAGDEVAVLPTEHNSNRSRSARHVSVCYDISQPSQALPELLSVDRLRSCLFMSIGSHGSLDIRQQLAKFQRLRALELSELGIEDVPHCIGDFRFLRYLNLSRNKFSSLPDSMSKLLNLITLDISECVKLKAWPKHMRRLINLRHLDYSDCPGLKQMPDGFGELTYLQHLSDFKPGGDKSMLEAFSKLTLKGKLRIDFAECRVQDNNDCWKLPATVKVLRVCSYMGARLPSWGDGTRDESAAANPDIQQPEDAGTRDESAAANPDIQQSEDAGTRDESAAANPDIQQSEDAGTRGESAAANPDIQQSEDAGTRDESAAANPDIQQSEDAGTRGESAAANPAIVYLELQCCKNLEQLPELRILRNLKTLVVYDIKKLEFVEQEDAGTTSPARFPCLENLSLVRLPQLKGWSRSTVKLEGCIFPRLEMLKIAECPGMELWGDGNKGVEWDSLSALRTLKVRPMPTSESCPPCLVLRKVQILEYTFSPEPAPVENNQTSGNDSVECATNIQSGGIPSA